MKRPRGHARSPARSTGPRPPAPEPSIKRCTWLPRPETRSATGRSAAPSSAFATRLVIACAMRSTSHSPSRCPLRTRWMARAGWTACISSTTVAAIIPNWRGAGSKAARHRRGGRGGCPDAVAWPRRARSRPPGRSGPLRGAIARRSRSTRYPGVRDDPRLEDEGPRLGRHALDLRVDARSVGGVNVAHPVVRAPGMSEPVGEPQELPCRLRHTAPGAPPRHRTRRRCPPRRAPRSAASASMTVG